MRPLIVILLILCLSTLCFASECSQAVQDSWSYVHLFGSCTLVSAFETLGFSPIVAWFCAMSLGILNELCDKHLGGKLWFDSQHTFDTCDIGFNMIGCNLAIFLHKRR